MVWAAALWRDRRTAGRHALGGILAGVVSGMLAAPLLGYVMATAGGAPFDDPQGVIAFLPVFQVALYVALCAAAWTGAGWTRLIGGFAILAVMGPASTFVLRAFVVHAGVAPHVRDIRAGRSPGLC